MEKRVFKVRSALLAQNGADIVYVNHESHLQQAKADSALLAAAPDLLAALEEMVATYGEFWGDAPEVKAQYQSPLIKSALQAIKKAKGE